MSYLFISPASNKNEYESLSANVVFPECVDCFVLEINSPAEYRDKFRFLTICLVPFVL